MRRATNNVLQRLNKRLSTGFKRVSTGTLGLIVAVLSVGVIGTYFLVTSQAATPTTSIDLGTNSQVTAPATTVSDTTASGGSAVVFPQPPAPPPTGSCVGAIHTPGGSDSMGGCWPGPQNTGYPRGLAGDTRTPVTLTNYSGPCTISSNRTLDKVDATGTCGAILVTSGARLTITNSKVPRLESTDERNLGSIVISDTTVLGGNFSDGSFWGYNLSATRAVITGGQHNVHCNDNCTIIDSWLYDQYNPNGGSYHNNPFISNGGRGMLLRHNTLHCTAILNATDGGCTADLSLFGDFDPITDVWADKNFLRANNSSISFCAYGGNSPGKPYPIATNIRYTDNIFERGPNGRCGVYGPVTSFQTTATGNVWSNNRFTDGVIINP